MQVRRLLLSVSCVLVCSLVLRAQVGSNMQGGYSHDAARRTTNADWMGKLPNDRWLSRVSIPGTHDTMSLYGVDSVKNQTMSLTDQLLSGVRALDIRCVISGEYFAIHHGSVYQNANFDDVLGATTEFLRDHPGEIILMRVKKERESDSNSKFEEIFLKYFNDAKYRRYFWTTPKMNFGPLPNPTLGELRGKIIILQSFPSVTTPGTLYGIDWVGLTIQDSWELSSNWALYDKWTEVKNQLQEAYGTGFKNYKIFVNFLTGNGGALPYFVASGKSSPGTNADLLLTGATTLFGANKDLYPDFPRIGCIYSACSIAFYGTNQLTTDWLYNQSRSVDLPKVGIIYADFPGPDLINQIIRFQPY